MNRLYPVFLSLESRRCVVVGGGEVALRKTLALLDCGANVTVVAPSCQEEMTRLGRSGQVEWIDREFRAGDLEGASLVVAAADDAATNRIVHDEAARRGVLCNVVDQPALCDFHVPAVVGRGDLKIAISTNGKSPQIAAGIRRMLSEQFGEEYEQVLAQAGRLREAIRRRHGEDARERAETLKSLIQPDALLDALKRGDAEKLHAIVDTWKSFLSD